MKTLKNFAAALLVILSVSAFAEEKPSNEKLEMNYALKTYIDAVAYGKVQALKDVLNDDVKFSFAQGKRILSFGKTEMLDFMKTTENVEQNCDLSFSTVEENSTQAIVKVSMKYKEFTRDSYINLLRTDKGWKITNVSSSFSE